MRAASPINSLAPEYIPMLYERYYETSLSIDTWLSGTKAKGIVDYIDSKDPL